MGLEDLPAFIRENYEIHEWKHDSAILLQDFPLEWQDIIDVFVYLKICK